MVDSPCEYGGPEYGSPAFYERILRQLLADIKARRHEINVERVAETNEQIQIATRNELNAELLTRERTIVMLIQEALKRIKDGKFGACGMCGEQIPEKRLNSIPYAYLCVPCTKQKEKLRREREGLSAYSDLDYIDSLRDSGPRLVDQDDTEAPGRDGK